MPNGPAACAYPVINNSPAANNLAIAAMSHTRVMLLLCSVEYEVYACTGPR